MFKRTKVAVFCGLICARLPIGLVAIYTMIPTFFELAEIVVYGRGDGPDWCRLAEVPLWVTICIGPYAFLAGFMAAFINPPEEL